MPNRKVVMQAPGVAHAFRPKRVGSSTCPTPGMTTDGTDSNAVSELAQGLPCGLTGVEAHIVHMAESGSISWSDAYSTIESL